MPHYPQLKTLADSCRFQSKENGALDALVFRDRVTTYEQLNQYASRVANGLAAVVVPQQRVAVLAKNSDCYFELLHGAAKAGVVLVGVNWRLAPPEVEFILRDSQSRVLFVGVEFLPLLESIRDELPLLEKVIVFREESSSVDDYHRWRDVQSDTEPNHPTSTQDIALQMYTSGTTGRPKGVQLSHGALMSLREAEYRVGEWSRWDTSDVGLVAMPLFHIGGTATGLIALYNGASSVIVAEVDPAEIIALISKYRVTRTFLVPAAIALVLDHPNCKPEVFESLKVLLY